MTCAHETTFAKNLGLGSTQLVCCDCGYVFCTLDPPWAIHPIHPSVAEAVVEDEDGPDPPEGAP